MFLTRLASGDTTLPGRWMPHGRIMPPGIMSLLGRIESECFNLLDISLKISCCTYTPFLYKKWFVRKKYSTVQKVKKVQYRISGS